MDDVVYPKSLGLLSQYVDRIEVYARDYLKYNKQEIDELISMWVKDDEKTIALLIKKGENPEEIMNYVSALDVSKVEYNEKLNEQLKLLSQSKIVYTNSTHGHIDDVLSGQLKIKDLFDDFYTTKESGYVFKHNPKAFELFLKYYNLKPSETLMIEDNPKYLKAAKENGISTIWVREQGTNVDLNEYPHIDYIVSDINQALDLFIKRS